MFWCNVTRTQLLDAMPKGGVVAEVGSYKGDFAAEILQRCDPKQLHLIDKWDFGGDEGYRSQANVLQEKDSEQVYRNVTARFAGDIKLGRVRITREDSLAAAKRYKPGTFDWIYLDADHRYEAVRTELATYTPLLKKGGILLGHDYEETSFPPAAKMEFGVTRAVRDFVAESDFKLFLLTTDMWATYGLARDSSDGGAAMGVIGRLLLGDAKVIVVDDPARTRFEFHGMVVNGRQFALRRVRAEP